MTKILPYIVIAGLLLFIGWQCSGISSKESTALQAKNDSLKMQQKQLAAKDSTIDDLNVLVIQSGQETIAAKVKVDNLENSLAASQRNANNLSKEHDRARTAKDTEAYKINCDEMAYQLNDSRDSIHNLMYEINSYKWGVNDFAAKYLIEKKLTDSLRGELIVARHGYRDLAGKSLILTDEAIMKVSKMEKKLSNQGKLKWVLSGVSFGAGIFIGKQLK